MRTRSLKAALDEGRDARLWYEREGGPAVAERFRRAYLSARSQIQRYPESGASLRHGVRRVLIEGFPYGIIYRLEADVALIIAIAHTSRRPDYWKGR